MENIQVEKQKTIPKGKREFILYADFENADKRYYEKLGDVVAPIEYLNPDGKLTRAGVKGLFRFQYPEQPTSDAFRKPLTPGTSYYPHEEVESNIIKAIENLNKYGVSSEFGDFKLHRIDDSHQGFTRYWTVLSGRRESVTVGDDLQFGITVRNGIGTQVALGLDLFSYRLVCSNGAIARGSRFGSVQILHRGAVEEIEQRFIDGIASTIEKAKKLLEYYKLMTEVKLSQKLLDYIVETTELPLRYLPENIVDIITPRDDKTLDETIIKLRDRNATIWELFNGITKPMTEALNTAPHKSRHLQFHGFAKQSAKLHNVIIQAIERPKVYL